ncbi:DUF1465 family protein [Sneathiella litorea]|uniref:DUF1465 family protein n=1 Tax=Sneathiella litorea TaxID=2606216 RepID=A0A6L8WAZ3_9PROT|nr:DUF1465 family protein [Sneathiella litorea]MZR32175.1 DUF1465 family protein [Sneathiella litorea]
MGFGDDEGTKVRSETIFFTRTYDETLDLVKEARSYLDGPGQAVARTMSAEASFGYAAETLRLTTRLTESMSWLLFQRALQEGEITLEESQEDECHLQHMDVCLADEPSCDLNLLPEELRSLLDRSERLYQRLVRLDEQGKLA